MQQLRRLNNLPIVSALLVGINLMVFLGELFSQEALVYLGGVQRTAIVEYHEYGRLVWAMFLHSDISHLFNNMIILFFLGSMLEKEVGHLWFTVIYFLSGIGGNLVSLAVKVLEQSEVPSIGASGAVFGLDGLLLALVLFSKSFRNTATPTRVILMILLSLYNGFMGQNIDNAAHVGGLIVGFVAGMVCIFFRKLFDGKREVRI
ncbi:MAG: rhomboid family intramembrane serine protease [Lachnospiraceae bacterium]|nr:rhomboid family intramembrane serine protease [Lachnospiraceae bacterium]